MKINLIIIFLLKAFCLFITEENNETKLNDEEKERLNFQLFIAEYRKNFSKINPIVLTDNNYSNYKKSHPYTLLYFHSFYDQNSVKFMPTFKFINDYLNSNYTLNFSYFYPVNLASIELSDDENNSEIQSRFRFSSFPFFIIYSSIHQKYIQYTGYMNAQSIITFSMKAILDNILAMNSQKRIKQLLNPQLTHMSIFCMKSSFDYDAFYRASQFFKFALFADCIGQKICNNYFNREEYKHSDIIIAKMNLCKNDFICGENNQIMDKNVKPYFILYNLTSYDDFFGFISINIIPLIHNMTDFNYELMIKNNFKTIIYIRGENEKKSNQKISSIIQKIVKKKKNGIKWGSILDPLNSQNDYEITKSLSVEVEDYQKNGLVLIHFPNKITKINEIYRINMKDIKELNEEIIFNFINEYNSGIIKRDIKSEIIPKHHPKKNLRMVVGKTFNKEILNNYNKTIILILLNLNLENLHIIEDQIESLSIKFGKYNDTIIFNFLDSELNEMQDMPKYDIFKKPYYRYYYRNKTKGFIDFKGKNVLDQSEIEDWIIYHYGKEYGIEHKYGMRMHIDGMTELLKNKNVLKEIEKQQKFEQFKEELGIKDDIIDKKDSNKETDL